MIPDLTDDQTRFLRLRSQRLLPDGGERAGSSAQVLQDVCGVQAQDLPSGLLSLRPRGQDLTAAQARQAMETAEITWTWCMRGTLHLLAVEDARWLVPFFAPGLIAGDRRRSEQLGWDAASTEQALRLVRDAVRSADPERVSLTRAEIRELLAANRLPHEGQATIHLIYRAVLEGLLCYGPFRGEEPAFTSPETWLGSADPLPRPQALSRLALRYLAAYAPAAPEDFASWSGLKLSEAREAWSDVSDQTMQIQAQGKPAWLLKTRAGWLEQSSGAAVSPPRVRLLPRYDTYLLGYATRSLTVNPRAEKRVHPGGGQISAVLLVDGRAAGVWKTTRRKARLEVRVAPFERLSDAVLPGLEAEVEDLGRFLGEETVLVADRAA